MSLPAKRSLRDRQVSGIEAGVAEATALTPLRAMQALGYVRLQ